MKQNLTESQSIRRAIFIVEARNNVDLIARKFLNEGTEYNTYLELSEAPVGAVINKIKSGLAKMPKQAAAKIAGAVKALPKAALPMAAAAIISATSGTDAQAGGMTPERLAELAAQLGEIAQDFKNPPEVKTGGINPDLIKQMQGQADAVGQAASDLQTGVVNRYQQK